MLLPLNIKHALHLSVWAWAVLTCNWRAVASSSSMHMCLHKPPERVLLALLGCTYRYWKGKASEQLDDPLQKTLTPMAVTVTLDNM